MAEAIRLGIALQGNGDWMGGIEYSKNLIKALYSLPAEERAEVAVIPLAGRPIRREFYHDMPSRFFDEVREPPQTTWRHTVTNSFSNRLLGRGHQVVRMAYDAGVDFLYPHFPAPFGLQSVPGAAWIPDFQHWHLPHLFKRRQRARRDRNFRRIARRASCVVLSSRTAELEFKQLYPFDAAKSRVLSFCSVLEPSCFQQDAAAVQLKYKLPQRYFVVCNQFWRHKNHQVIFEALRVLRRRSIHPHVVCTGKLGDYRHAGYAKEVVDTIRSYGLDDQVHLLGLIPRSDQLQLIRRAIALAQPSLFEGWSTVVEDARALGKPIALSRIDVHREQDPPHAAFFDAHSGEELAAIFERWWEQLPVGPHCELEADARTRNCIGIAEFARRFLKIAGATI